MATMSRSIKSLLSHSSLFRALSSNPIPPPLFTRSFHSDDIFGDSKGDAGPFESTDDFEKRLFGFNSRSSGNGGGDGPITDSFYRKLDRIEKAHGHGRSSTPGFGPRSRMNDGGRSMVERFDTLSDGMDDKLKRAATTFQVSDEILNDDYAFRPDVTFLGGTTYTPRDLDLTKPGIQKSPKRAVFETTTAEVLRKADFRNVRFLANFLTEAGIIIKRSQRMLTIVGWILNNIGECVVDILVDKEGSRQAAVEVDGERNEPLVEC